MSCFLMLFLFSLLSGIQLIIITALLGFVHEQTKLNQTLYKNPNQTKHTTIKMPAEYDEGDVVRYKPVGGMPFFFRAFHPEDNCTELTTTQAPTPKPPKQWVPSAASQPRTRT